MTKRVGNVVVIAPEEPRACEFCGTVQECRLYGPEGRQICFPCSRKPEYLAEAKRRLNCFLDGDEP